MPLTSGAYSMPIGMHLWPANTVENRGTCAGLPPWSRNQRTVRNWAWRWSCATVIQLGNSPKKNDNIFSLLNYWKQGQGVVPDVKKLLQIRNTYWILCAQQVAREGFVCPRRLRQWLAITFHKLWAWMVLELACSRAVMNFCRRIMLMLLGLSCGVCVFVSVFCMKLWMLINLLGFAACLDF